MLVETQLLKILIWIQVKASCKWHNNECVRNMFVPLEEGGEGNFYDSTLYSMVL